MSRIFSISHLGVEVAPHTPTVLIPLNHLLSISSVVNSLLAFNTTTVLSVPVPRPEKVTVDVAPRVVISDTAEYGCYLFDHACRPLLADFNTDSVTRLTITPGGERSFRLAEEVSTGGGPFQPQPAVHYVPSVVAASAR